MGLVAFLTVGILLCLRQWEGLPPPGSLAAMERATQDLVGGRGMTPDKRTMIVLPTYNEAHNLQDVVEPPLGLGIQGVETLVVDQRVWQMRLFPRDSEEE